MTECDLLFQHCTGLGLINDTTLTKVYHLSIGLVEATFNNNVNGQVINLVLSRFVDAQCKTLDTGEGVQQSWFVAPLQNSVCYDVSVGLNCGFRCNLKLTCEYATGSGVVLEEYPLANCEGTMMSRIPLAKHLTWQGALNFFNGQCTPTGDGKYMSFNKPVDSHPDCSAQGAVDVGEGADVAYEERYYMQFYNDNGCRNPYQVTLRVPSSTTSTNGESTEGHSIVWTTWMQVSVTRISLLQSSIQTSTTSNLCVATWMALAMVYWSDGIKAVCALEYLKMQCTGEICSFR